MWAVSCALWRRACARCGDSSARAQQLPRGGARAQAHPQVRKVAVHREQPVRNHDLPGDARVARQQLLQVGQVAVAVHLERDAARWAARCSTTAAAAAAAGRAAVAHREARAVDDRRVVELITKYNHLGALPPPRRLPLLCRLLAAGTAAGAARRAAAAADAREHGQHRDVGRVACARRVAVARRLLSR